MDVLEHLTKEHRKAELLMQGLTESAAGTERDQLLAKLEEMLETHMKVEERFLYPIVAEVLEEEKAEEAEVEHDLARDGLAKLKSLADAPGFGAGLDMVKAGVGHHVEEEEQQIFPALRERAGDRLAALDPDELEALATATRDELYRKAQETGVPGRSQMTKEELAEAVTSQ